MFFALCVVSICSVSVWIGASRTTDPGTCGYSWTPDNLTAAAISTNGWSSSPWHDGDPNCVCANGVYEACVGIAGSYDYTWYDMQCAAGMCPLCELAIP